MTPSERDRTRALRPPRIGSLCSGYGGLDLGLITVVGGSVAWHAEVDKHPAAVLEARFPGVPNLGDITTVDWSQVEPVDWLTAGYPCQPDSLAGKGLSEDDERWIWPDVAHAIGVLRPRHLLLENVPGHFVRGFRTVLGSLTSLGYDAGWILVRASDVGAPHRRERLFVVATDADRRGLRQQPISQLGERRAAIVGADGPIRTAPDATGDGRHEGWAESARVIGRPDDAERSHAPTDTDLGGLQSVGGELDERRDADGRGGQDVAWGDYESAIRRWEAVLGRSAPYPTMPNGRGGRRLNPRLNEWMMGLPDGWVTDILPRSPALKCLGNGVVPQQAALAARTLLNVGSVAA